MAREREREGGREGGRERGREGEREREREKVCVCVCVCACVCVGLECETYTDVEGALRRIWYLTPTPSSLPSLTYKHFH